jgi:hypothetical protein
MDQQAFQLLLLKIESLQGQHDRIEKKVDELLEFKWKIYGGSLVIGFAGSFAMNIIMKVF